jgi:hypothetical protein
VMCVVSSRIASLEAERGRRTPRISLFMQEQKITEITEDRLSVFSVHSGSNRL